MGTAFGRCGPIGLRPAAKQARAADHAAVGSPRRLAATGLTSVIKDAEDVLPRLHKDALMHREEELRTSALPLEATEVDELWKLIFGEFPEEDDVDRWLRSSFLFVGAEAEANISETATLSCPWGLRQEFGGPCGVLAVVQAFIIKELLWGEAAADHKLLGCSHSRSSSAASTAAPSAASLDTDSDSAVSLDGQQQQQSQSPPCSESPVKNLEDILAERFSQQQNSSSQKLLACVLARMLYKAADGSRYFWLSIHSKDQIIRHEFSTATALANWLVATDALLPFSPCPLLSLVCSLVMTRGTAQLQADMDNSQLPLIGLFGHCSQELTNLCLSGRAVTNVFDGDVSFEDGEDTVCLHGIQARPEIGFLSTLEPLKLCEVGNLLKQPEYPLWVLGTSSHYSLLIAGDCALNHLGSAPLEDSACKAYDCARHGESCSSLAATAPTQFLFYNGRADVAPWHPVLTALELQMPQDEVSRYEAPAGLISDDDSRLFVETLRTRWPGAEVSFPQVGDNLGPASPPRIN